jgi:branched-subunit amino acid aminotransferase/4-amino-4-deoxychorismate lyase
VIQAWRVDPPDPARAARGITVIVSQVRRDRTSPLASLKTTSRADLVYGKLEADAAGADDAIFLTHDGFIAEATTANVFLVAGDRLLTPSVDCGILPGTTRDWCIRWAGASGLRVEEAELPLSALVDADEAFLTSSVAGITPVTALRLSGVPDAPISGGRPGAWAREAQEARESFVRGGPVSAT